MAQQLQDALTSMLARVGKSKDDFRPQSNIGRLFRRHGVEKTPELDRIRRLPMRTWEDDPGLEQLCLDMTDWLRRPGGSMVLWPVQAKALEELHDWGGMLGPIPVGKGKTIVSYLGGIVAGAVRPLLLVPAKLRKKTKREFLELKRHWHAVKPAILSYEEIGRDAGWDKLEVINPDLVVMDECFPGGTTIKCPEGARRIDTIKTGDLVVAAGSKGLEPAYAVNAWSSKTATLFDIVLDTVPQYTITTTARHPFLTEKGWRRAEELQNGDEIVRVVQEGQSERRAQDILLNQLRSKVEDGSTIDQRKNIHQSNSEKGVKNAPPEIQERRIQTSTRSVTQAYAGEKSYAQPGVTSKSIKYSQAYRACTKNERWQRETITRTTEGASRSFRLGDGVYSEDRQETRKRVPDLLQDRYSKPLLNGSSRSGWGFAQQPETQSTRQKEESVFGITRMARIASIKQRSVDPDSTDGKVYNLEIGCLGTYILAESGAVVHNCHKIKNRQAGVTRKLLRWHREHPETKLCAMSGNITTRSLRDYGHLAEWACGKLCPMPTRVNWLADWADALDEKVSPDKRMAPGALLALCNDAELEEISKDQSKGTEVARRAYRRRLVSTPTVVAMHEDELGTSLQITVQQPIPGPKTWPAFKKLRQDWETPNGVPLTEASEVWRHARTLACGFYYKWWNQEGFMKCLAKILKPTTLAEGLKEQQIQKQHAPEIVSIIKRILNESGRKTENDTGLAEVLETHLFANDTLLQSTSKTDTASQLMSTRNFTTNLRAGVTSVARNEDLGKNVEVLGGKGSPEALQLITIIKQARSEDCSVWSVTDRLAVLEILLKHYPALLPMLKESCEAAKAPKEWMDARREWARFVREALGRRMKNVDTELQVAKACDAGRLPSKELDVWRSVRDTFKPNSVPVWIDGAMLAWCAKWLDAQDGPAIIWCEHVAFCERLANDARLPYFGRGGVDKVGREIEEIDGAQHVIASVASNHEGRNLQGWSRNLVVSAQPNGRIKEQLIGRTHRSGQQADEVAVDLVVACIEQWEGINQSVADARYIEQTTGQPQKLLYADWDGMPTAQDVAALQRSGDPMWSK